MIGLEERIAILEKGIVVYAFIGGAKGTYQDDTGRVCMAGALRLGHTGSIRLFGASFNEKAENEVSDVLKRMETDHIREAQVIDNLGIVGWQDQASVTPQQVLELMQTSLRRWYKEQETA